MHWSRIIYAILFIGSIGFFAFNLYRLFALLCLGQWENRFDHLTTRAKTMFLYAFGQLRVVKRGFGINHFMIFWGFMILLMLNGEFLIGGLFPQFSWAFLGVAPYSILLVLTEIMSVVVLLAVMIAVSRRLFFRPNYIDQSMDAFFILGMIAALMLAYFGYHAGEIALAKTEWAKVMPVSNYFAGFLTNGSVEGIHLFTEFCWWIHAIVLLLFMNYLPYSKHLHVLTAIPNCFFRSFDIPKTVPPTQFEWGNNFGISKITQFSWKDLLDFMACTECGRCQSVCPAYDTDKHLNPKEMIHRGKYNLFKNGKPLLAKQGFDSLAQAPEDAELNTPLIGEGYASFPEEDLWSCTTCGACMVECPVFIEHVPKFIESRRSLVMEDAEFPEELLTFFENSEQRFNPWGIAPTDRAKWADDLDVPILSELEEPVEYLFFVGCSGAFDSRTRLVVTALSKILNKAGLSWAILGNEEKCCGDSQRRLGNEYLFDKLAKENISLFKQRGITKIITHCPHCFTTLKNDYKQFGIDLEVIHHSELIARLIDDGTLKVSQPVKGKTVVHDSCYLGRYNNIYDAPRTVLKQTCGTSPDEMERSHEKSYCCGAGGGRMWLEELEGGRIYVERTKQALESNPDTIAVSCPYCMTMFEDGVKHEDAQDKVRVKDIAEITAEALDL